MQLVQRAKQESYNLETKQYPYHLHKKGKHQAKSKSNLNLKNKLLKSPCSLGKWDRLEKPTSWR